jgi:hypothetical protein
MIELQDLKFEFLKMNLNYYCLLLKKLILKKKKKEKSEINKNIDEENQF